MSSTLTMAWVWPLWWHYTKWGRNWTLVLYMLQPWHKTNSCANDNYVIWLLSCCYCFTDVVKSRTKVWCSSYNCAAGACTGTQLAAHMPTVCLVAFKASCLLRSFSTTPSSLFFFMSFPSLLLGLLSFGILYSLYKAQLAWKSIRAY